MRTDDGYLVPRDLEHLRRVYFESLGMIDPRVAYRRLRVADAVGWAGLLGSWAYLSSDLSGRFILCLLGVVALFLPWCIAARQPLGFVSYFVQKWGEEQEASLYDGEFRAENPDIYRPILELYLDDLREPREGFLRMVAAKCRVRLALNGWEKWAEKFEDEIPDVVRAEVDGEIRKMSDLLESLEAVSEKWVKQMVSVDKVIRRFSSMEQGGELKDFEEQYLGVMELRASVERAVQESEPQFECAFRALKELKAKVGG